MMSDQRSTTCAPHDHGFSLVEVVITMVLFAFLSVGILPLLLSITQLTAQNSDTETARGAVSADMAILREHFPTDPAIASTTLCSDLATLGTIAVNPTDIGSGMEVTRTAESCPGTYPAAVAVHYEVRRAAGGDVVATFDTSFRVTQ